MGGQVEADTTKRAMPAPIGSVPEKAMKGSALSHRVE